jgi:predicted ArsR family transcriptional regulator
VNGRAVSPVAGPAARIEPPGIGGTVAGGARERRAQIERLVAEQERVSVADLTRRFLVTEASIRRDLVILEGEGRSTRRSRASAARRRRA